MINKQCTDSPKSMATKKQDGMQCTAIVLCLPLMLILLSCARAPEKTWTNLVEMRDQVRREMLTDTSRAIVRYSESGAVRFWEKYDHTAFPVLLDLFQDRSIEQLNREKIAFYMGKYFNPGPEPHPAIAPIKAEIEYVLSRPLDKEKERFLWALSLGLGFTRDRAALEYLSNLADSKYWQHKGQYLDQHLVMDIRRKALYAIGAAGTRKAHKQLALLGRKEAADLPSTIRGAKKDCRSRYGFGRMKWEVKDILRLNRMP